MNKILITKEKLITIMSRYGLKNNGMNRLAMRDAYKLGKSNARIEILLDIQRRLEE